MTLKPPMVGLVDRAGIPSDDAATFVHGFVIRALWSDLQPTPGPLVPDVIDQALDAADGKRVKLRVYGGSQAPEWLMDADGDRFTFTDGDTLEPVTAPRWWGPNFGAAYVELQRLLADRYDDDDRLSEVTVSRCMGVYAETMTRDLRPPGNLDAFRAAGFSADVDIAAIMEQIDAHTVWERTYTGLACNPYPRLLANGKIRADVGVTVRAMDRARTKLGERAVIENNSVRSGPQSEEYGFMYTAMAERGAPITVQTATQEKIGSWADALRWAATDLGASAVELPRRYEDWDRATLIELGGLFLANT